MDWRITFMFAALRFLAAACAQRPVPDQRFLDRDATIGSPAAALEQRLIRRGFTANAYEWYGHGDNGRSMVKGLPPFNPLGGVAMIGAPAGPVTCRAKDFDYLIANGIRIICRSVSAGKVAWRQAGLVGADL